MTKQFGSPEPLPVGAMTNSTTPSTSKCCEKCYDPYSTQGYDITSPCGNPDCPCHTTHNLSDKEIKDAITALKSGKPDFSHLPHNQEESLDEVIGYFYDILDDIVKWDKFTQTDRVRWANELEKKISKLRQSAIQEERERLAGLIENMRSGHKELETTEAKTRNHAYFYHGGAIEAYDDVLSLIRTNTK